MSGLTVVLGASGGIGSALVTELVARGERVRAVGRRITADDVPAGVEVVAADVTTPDGARRAVDGASVVHHAAQPDYTRWSTEFPPMNDTVLAATAAVGAKLVVADNLYCYGPVTAPMTESTPTAATDAKGRLRTAEAARFLEAHSTGRCRVVLGRASDYLGPGGVGSALGETFFGRLAAGRKAQWIGRLDRPHTMSYLPDVAKALVVLGEDDRADGRAWHLPGDACTGAELLDLTGTVLGRPARATAAPPLLLRTMGLFVPMMRELAEVSYQWTGPWVVDHSAYDATFGPLPVTPLQEAVEVTTRWWLDRAGRRGS